MPRRHRLLPTAVTPIVTLLLLAACSDGAGPADAGPAGPGTPTTTSPPEVEPGRLTVEVELLEVDTAPLVADLRVRADRPVVPVVTVEGPGGTFAVPPPDAGTEHRIPVAGMRAAAEHVITVEFVDPTGTPAPDPHEAVFVTPAVPDDLPPLETTVSRPDRMAAGVTLFNVLDLGEIFAPGPGTDPDDAPWFGWLVVVDADGEIIWYHRAPHPMGDARMLDDGTLLVEYNDTGARRINLFGEVLEEWAGERIRTDLRLDRFGRQVAADDAVAVATDSMHHHVDRLPTGNLLTLSTELRIIDGFAAPLCGEAPGEFDGSYHLIADVIVEFEPDTGTIVREWSLFDYFPLPQQGELRNVCGLPNPGVFPNWLYQGDDPRARDWTHANAVVLDETRNALIVSIRHLDALLALRYAEDDDGLAGEVLWELGPNGTLELLGGDWLYHPHAPEVQADGSILVYDNGNGRPGVEPYTRVVLYDVDDAAGTVTQRWQHVSRQDGQPAFAPFVGDADRLANGNVLVTDGGLFGAVDDVSAQIVEIVPGLDDAGNEIVFEMRLRGGQQWAVYRAERLPSLYGD